jgi:hypothetical protein
MSKKINVERKGSGVMVTLNPAALWEAIHAYIITQGIHIGNVTTTKVNGKKMKNATVFVDPSCKVIYKGKEI